MLEGDIWKLDGTNKAQIQKSVIKHSVISIKDQALTQAQSDSTLESEQTTSHLPMSDQVKDVS